MADLVTAGMMRPRQSVLVAIVLLLGAMTAGCAALGTPPIGDAGGIEIVALAGPVCPVERPGDLACEPRRVAGAQVVIRDGSGAEVARVTLDDAGTAFVALSPGAYMVEAQPVEGLMGTPGPVQVTVNAGQRTVVELAYDTGIR